MKSPRFFRRCSFALAAALAAGFALAATAAAEEINKPKVSPDRVIVVGELPPPSPQVGTTPAEPQEGRVLPPVDAAGVRRKPGEARFLTGSFIPQKFELYGNVNNSALNVRTYTQADLGFGRGILGSGVNGVGASTTVPHDQIVERTTQRYQLDLRKVAPERRLAVATQLLGEERGSVLVAKFNRWEALRKKRLAAR